VTRRTFAGEPVARPRSGQLLWQACCQGREPAEALDPRDREDLVEELVVQGWTDTEIATLTRMSTYTTARIRTRLGLPPNAMAVAA
jgi:hypothetical protein